MGISHLLRRMLGMAPKDGATEKKKTKGKTATPYIPTAELERDDAVTASPEKIEETAATAEGVAETAIETVTTAATAATAKTAKTATAKTAASAPRPRPKTAARPEPRRVAPRHSYGENVAIRRRTDGEGSPVRRRRDGEPPLRPRHLQDEGEETPVRRRRKRSYAMGEADQRRGDATFVAASVARPSRPPKAENVAKKPSTTDSRLLTALAGLADPFDAEDALEDFIALGWEKIKDDVAAFAFGKRSCLKPYLKRIVECYPEECAALLTAEFEQFEKEQRLLFLEVCGGESAAAVAAEVEKLLPALAEDDLAQAFSVLAAFPSREGNALLSKYLLADDWRLRMRAAAALAKADATEAVSAIRAAAAASDGAVAAGLSAIAAEIEAGKGGDER